jgi:hypothetical protein
MTRSVLGGSRLLLAALTLAAVVTQLVHGVDSPVAAVEFLSYFTIESNLIAAGVLLIAGVRALRGRPNGRALDLWRGAATLYMVTTGLGYAVLLGGEGTLLGWVDVVLHYLMPVALALDWILDRPESPIPFDRALVWMAFPTAFIAYTLVRGEIVDWYPYPFVDVADRGYPAVIVTALVVGAAMVAVTAMLVWTRFSSDASDPPAS